MRVKTKQVTTQIREALLALPDRILLKTILDWIALAEEHLQYPEWSDEYRYALGFRVQSLDSQTIYATFEAMHDNEPTTRNARWLEPGMSVLRMIITNFSHEQFYHTIIPLAADALFDHALKERWGRPPSSQQSGYEFLQNLLEYLETKVYRHPERPVSNADGPLDPYPDEGQKQGSQDGEGVEGVQSE